MNFFGASQQYQESRSGNSSIQEQDEEDDGLQLNNGQIENLRQLNQGEQSSSEVELDDDDAAAESIDDAELAALRKQRSAETFDPNHSATFGKINKGCSLCQQHMRSSDLKSGENSIII